MIYITGGSMGFAGGANVTLNGPTRGTYQGLLFWQDKNDTTASSLTGGATELLNGVLYFPTVALTYTGGSATHGTNTTIVSKTLTLVGNSYVSTPALNVTAGLATAGTLLIE